MSAMPSSAVAIGSGAGATSQGQQAVAIGDAAGGTTQGGSSIAIGRGAASSTQGNTAIAMHADHVIYVPRVRNELMPLLAVVPLQVMAYHIASLRGLGMLARV